jgi:hypothetical protein
MLPKMRNTPVPTSMIVSRIPGVRTGDTAKAIEATRPSSTVSAGSWPKFLPADQIGDEHPEAPAEGECSDHGRGDEDPRWDSHAACSLVAAQNGACYGFSGTVTGLPLSATMKTRTLAGSV